MPALFHHQNAHPVAHNFSICELDDLDPYVALQTFQSDGFLPNQRDEKGAIRRRYSLRATEAFTCDDFRMYEYKVRRCVRGRSHDWTDCPFAHPGEKARRRDPRKVHYSGSPCPEFRKGNCRRGDACEFAHGVFECYLHPARYRTQACKDGRRCGRRVCFFAHSIQELRHVALPTEDSIAENDRMVDTYTHDMRLPRTVSLEDGSSVVVLEDHFPVVADSIEDSSLHSEYANVGNLCEVLSVLALPSHDVGFPTEVGLLSDMVPMLHSPSRNALGMSQRKSSASFLMGALFQNNSVSCMPALILPTFDSHLEGLSSPENASLQPSYLDRSSLQETAMLNAMLMSEGFGEPPLSARENEFSDMVQSIGFARGETLPHGCLDGFRSGDYVVNEVERVSTQLAALGKEMYEFSSYNGYGSYALPSPTSTLAGPLCSPSCSSTPLSSPPLSPQSTPSSDSTSTFFMQGGHNLLRDNTSCKGDVFTQNRHREKEFRINTIFMDQQSLHDRHHSLQYKWSPLCDYWNPNNNIKCDILQQAFSDVPGNTCGEFRVESPSENAIPDLGWVNELVM